MHITIHRGIDQIGGCITEIESNNGTKILIDLGHNLPDGDQPSDDPLDKPENLDDLLEGVSAVFYTHPHGDHLGFETRIVEKGITQYIGEISKEMMLTLKDSILFRTKGEKKKEAQAAYDAIKSFETYKANVPVWIKDKDGNNDIKVTPYYVSHSAADAYMFIVECDKKKVLHTGDFRDHGYQGYALLPMVDYYIVRKKIDVLITEGTMLSRDDIRLISEEELINKLLDLQNAIDITVLLCSNKVLI
jgi:ribonuclease J